jgi:hypothetical protein
LQGTKTDEPAFDGLSWNSSVIGRGIAVAQISEATPSEDSSMLDILMVALALGFFALSVGYAYACDRL